MFQDTLVTRSVTTEAEFHRAIDLQARLMAGAGYFDYREKMEREAQLWPSLKREDVRVALLNGRIVSTFRIFPLRVRIGCVTVPIGGINNVCTHPRYRKKGYMNALLTDAIGHMRESGALVSVLHGIPDFYYRFGYASIGCDYTLTIQARVLTSLRKSLRIRKARENDLPDIRRLYDETNTRRTCTIVRDDRVWSRLRPELARVRVIVDGTNKVRGYFWLANRKDIFKVTEVCAENEEPVLQTLLAECGRLCRLGVFAEAQFHVPPDDPLAVYCRRYDAAIETRYKRNSGWMMRIINLDRLFSALEAELSRRVKMSHLAGWCGSFCIETDIGSVCLTVSEDSVRCAPKESGRTSETISLPQSLLSQLLVGYRSGEELREEIGPLTLRDIVRVLFSPGHPFICPEDMF